MAAITTRVFRASAHPSPRQAGVLEYLLAGRGGNRLSFDGKGDEQRGSLSGRAHDLDRSAQRFDPVGHYHRPDVLRLERRA